MSSEQHTSGWRLGAHALGNVFLGVAVGLLGYYFATNLLMRGLQSSLDSSFPIKAGAAPAPAAKPDPLDFEGWTELDQAYWEELEEGEAFGRLVIERMELDTIVVKGTQRADLMKGPGWIEWSDLPGPEGNCGISGHRTTYGAPFRRLNELKEGDTILFYSPYRVYEYRMKRLFSVTPDRGDVVEEDGEVALLTLTACHPPYSARYRLIAQSELVSVTRLQQ